MKEYINNLLPRLREFSQNLDKKELFVDVPWVLIDSEQNYQKYIFKRNGELIMSLNGGVVIGKWEYLATAKSLLIDRVKDKVLLNQNFIDSAVMVLKLDGLKDENFVLANEVLIPDLDVLGYLKRLWYAKNNITLKKLDSGKEIEFHSYDPYVGTKVTIDGNEVQDQVFSVNPVTRWVIKQSALYRILKLQEYDTNRGKILIERDEYGGLHLGDLVFQKNIQAPDGKYKVGFLDYIHVENGKIKKMTSF